MADATENQNKEQKTSHTVSKGKPKESSAEPTTTKMPETYPYIDETLTSDFRQYKFVDDIITDCKPCECEYGFECYTDNGEVSFDGEWQAVWTSRHLGCDVLVLVKKKCFPNALVELVEPFCCSHPNSFADYALDGSGHKPKTKDDVTKFLSSKKHEVPLLELLPVLEQPEDLNKEEEENDDEWSFDIDAIAEFLELYRFFYAYLWRSYFDEFHGGDYCFHGEPMFYRMMLHYDVQEKNTTPAIIESYNKTMAEYVKKAWQFNTLRNDFLYPNRDKELQKIGNEVVSLEKTLEKLIEQNQDVVVFHPLP